MNTEQLDSSSLENQEEQTETNDKFNRKSKMVKKFLEKFSFLDLDYTTEGFTNPQTQQTFENFKIGWMSHPCFSLRSASIIGKLSDEGLEFATIPRFHASAQSANREAKRLELAYPNNIFVVFQTAHQQAIDYIRQRSDKFSAKKAKLCLAKLRKGLEEQQQ